METEQCPYCKADEVRESERDYPHWRQFECGSLFLEEGNIDRSQRCAVRSSWLDVESARADFGNAVAQLVSLTAEVERLKKNSIELSDEWRQEEPLAYLVKNFNQATHEYMVFANLDEAQSHADHQQQDADDAGEPEDWCVYPLYAGKPKEPDNARRN